MEEPAAAIEGIQSMPVEFDWVTIPGEFLMGSDPPKTGKRLAMNGRSTA